MFHQNDKRFHFSPFIFFTLIMLYSSQLIYSDELDRYKVKREEKFEFEVKPSLTKQDNSYIISFTTKNFCDVSICIINNEEKILRHLVSGVLGDNAPFPLIKNSLKQEIKWDMKDDQGKYVEQLENIKVQVSLGLKPEFERTLYWDPKRKINIDTPVVKAIKEGVLIYNGKGVDHFILLSHNGEYLKTIYPYSSEIIKNISDIAWQELPQGGKYPKKNSFLMQTLLTSGNNSPEFINGRDPGDKEQAMHGNAATAIGAIGNKVCLIKKSINRFSLSATDKDFQKNGPIVTKFTAVNPNSPYYGPNIGEIYPKSAAFSPDGKWLYLAGYYHMIGDPRGNEDYNCLHGITRVAYDKNEPYEVFLGKMTKRTDRSNNMKDAGDDNEHFTCATSVACDNEGRIYVSDYMNNRIQIFSEGGKFIKTIKTPFPSKISFHPTTGDIYVLSWLINNPKLEDTRNFMPTLHVYGSFDNPILKEKYDLPFLKSSGTQNALPHGGVEGSEVMAELDLWGERPILWAAAARNSLLPLNLYQLKDKKWEILSKSEDTVKNNLGAFKNPIQFPQVQNLYVNQMTGNLYIGEPDQVQNFSTLIEVNPITGKCKEIPLPFQTVDMAFDINGFIYLRKVDLVGRFDFSNWREIPFDYGVEAIFVDYNGKKISLVSALPLPSVGSNQTYQGGMSVSPNGNIAISCFNGGDGNPSPIGKVTNISYKLQNYPGKISGQAIHIWDKHGKVLAEDTIPGLGRVDGVWLDVNNNLFVMSAMHRVINSKVTLSNLSSTVMKFSLKKGKVISDLKREDLIPLVLPVGSEPNRTNELTGLGNVWVEDSSWMYGGVGFSGKHLGTPGLGCCCWHSNFTLDFYGRSFAPEVDQYDVAVLDSNGNLILKIGKYGNLDDGMPLIKEGGSPNPKSIGGDEVSLFHAAFVATHSDNRVFIADFGNGRVVSVKLNYHNSVKLNLQ